MVRSKVAAMKTCFCVLLQFIQISLKVNNTNNLSPSYLYILHGSDLMSFTDKGKFYLKSVVVGFFNAFPQCVFQNA